MKSLFEEMGGTYRWDDDYLIPNLDMPETVPLGIWGQRRRRYLQNTALAYTPECYLLGH